MIKVGDIDLAYADYVTIIRKDMTIAYSSRFDMNRGEVKPEINVRDKNFFDIYPEYDFGHSALQKSLYSGAISSSLNDTYKDYKGKIHCTDGISFPIMDGGEIIGAIELSRDRTTIKNIINKNESYISSNAKIEGNDAIVFNDDPFTSIFTVDDKMKALIDRARLISQSKSHTLIYGETGTGKELFTQAMIEYGGYKKNKVIIHNCASTPENLAESILFGSEEGAFTGAKKKNGLFYEADGGVLFLDELNSLPYSVQGKLLRVLQDGKYRPVGSNREIKVDVKIIATMNINPIIAMEKNELRGDLFYRLSGNMLSIIPLRERKDDIIPTAKYFMTEANKNFSKNVNKISKGLEKFFLNYPWEGNVRELKNTVESMVLAAESDTLTVDELPGYMFDKYVSLSVSDVYELSVNEYKDTSLNLKEILERTEKRIIEEAMIKNDWNASKACIELGIPRQTLQYKLDKLQIRKK